ncbi:ABC transporter ATP-binding protein [Ralstonia solanacearum]|uniref:Permease and ATP-binding protein of yersiniabactin-iron ABC transporter YbtQ n=1 Tax=Ralstonia solanacearum CFBP2957 TaxID=859656 RepID=D8P4R5_RALSL|nr:ABC transporter ATP-binding protein [Ralstonia solanacearum]CBJ53901.1 permease and ATP-binding protein of yersiniabactin-iron ABC transporter YbtQ [Ralstonia solanacearum CFBP2957]
MNQDATDRKRPASLRHAYRRLLDCAGPNGPNARALHRSMIGLGVAAAAQGLALACLFPLLSALVERRSMPLALAWLAAMTLAAAFATAVRWRSQGFEYNGRLAQTTHTLRMRLGEQLRRMPLETLQDKRAGEMNALLLGSVDEHLNYTIAIANLILLATVTPCVVALAALCVDWRVGVILLFVFPAIVPIYRWRQPGLERGMRTLAEVHQRVSADIVEFTQGLPVLRAACGDSAKANGMDQAFDTLHDVQTATYRQGVKPDLAVASVVELGLQLVVVATVAWVVMGTLDLSVVAAVMVIVVRFAEPMATLIGYAAVVELIETALERIEALLSIAPLPQRGPSRVPSRFDLRFDGVSFRYARATDTALDDFSATLPTNGMTALVGPSGSGKSTIARLLLRHADPQGGAITIGGVDLRRIPEPALNAMISVVFQDVYLFDDTVLANVRMARPEATDDEVMAVARAAHCDEFIERLPQGWQTRLGEIGGRLSGGERQRISIARALLKNAPIVVLDEPTAALDVESELAVQRAIDVLVRDRTVIVIAHRLSTIVGADRILVIDGGRLVQQGRHAELVRVEGRYRAMWHAQSGAHPDVVSEAAASAPCVPDGNA